jgi:hypothetical protein
MGDETPGRVPRVDPIVLAPEVVGDEPADDPATARDLDGHLAPDPDDPPPLEPEGRRDGPGPELAVQAHAAAGARMSTEPPQAVPVIRYSPAAASNRKTRSYAHSFVTPARVTASVPTWEASNMSWGE